MSTQPTSATPNGDAAAADTAADAATGTATTKNATNENKNASSAKEAVDEGVVPFDTVASSKAWTEPAKALPTEDDETLKAAQKIQEEDAEKRAENPNKVYTREPLEGIGGQDFVVAAGPESETLAAKVAKEDFEAKTEDPNRIVKRTPDKKIGGASFEVG